MRFYDSGGTLVSDHCGYGVVGASLSLDRGCKERCDDGRIRIRRPSLATKPLKFGGGPGRKLMGFIGMVIDTVARPSSQDCVSRRPKDSCETCEANPH